MAFIVNFMMEKRIRSNDTVFVPVEKHVHIRFQEKSEFIKSIFFRDMYIIF